MTHQQNRLEQLEDFRNITTTNADLYEQLAAGKIATLRSGSNQSSVASGEGNTQTFYVPVPVTIKSQIGSPTALGIGSFATTLTTLSCALMGFRGVSTTNAFIGDFFGVAGIAMFVSANWELVRGNTYAYTVLAAFGLFYAGYGFIITPSFGVAASYPGGEKDPEYLNAVGFFVLLWSVWNIFFLLGSLPLNFVYIMIFLTVQLAFTLVAAYYFLAADGYTELAENVKIAAGAFAFASGMFGYYTVANLMCSEALFFSFPMGDTSRFFLRKEKGAVVAPK